MWMTCLDPGHEHLDADTKPMPTKTSSTDFAASSPKSDGIISIGKLETPLEGVESLWDWRAPRSCLSCCCEAHNFGNFALGTFGLISRTCQDFEKFLRLQRNVPL